MRLNRFLKTMGPLAALVAMGALAGCDKVHFNVGEEGVPLAELDLGGTPPDSVALLGPDTVIVSEGADFTITVDGEGPVAERMRFKLDGGTLGILREGDNWSEEGGIATVRVTMPPPNSLSLAGSGTMVVAAVSDTPQANIAGSGTLELPNVAAGTMTVNIAGSGTLNAAGTADRLNLNVMGSGSAAMAGLKVESASVNIAGSGDATFSSDGSVDANIVGSGDVTVRGSARCKVNSVGSGSLVCERESESTD